MSHRPRITVVTPSFQQAKYIQATIDSVAHQTYPEIEHIVIDGGSTDGTVELLRAAAEATGLRWVSEPDNGQGDAINKGMAMAAGDIVTWLNSDDVYLGPGVLETVVERFERGAVAATGGGWWLSEDGALVKPIRVDPRRVRHGVALHVDWFLQPATFYTRELALRYPIDVSLRYAFDWDLFIRMTRDVEFAVIDAPIAGYRVHAGGKTVGGGLERQRELLTVVRRYAPRSVRARTFGALVWLHGVAAGLPAPLARIGYRLLTTLARLTNRLSGGRGLPS